MSVTSVISNVVSWLLQALHLAEQLHGGASQTPQVGVVLGLLGHVYACSKRITLAEGLHRSAPTAKS